VNSLKIIAHNHPSGSLTVGKKDREVTQRIKESGELLGIRLDEHIIIAGDEFVSAF
jgi:DNA repair protein RadC